MEVSDNGQAGMRYRGRVCLHVTECSKARPAALLTPSEKEEVDDDASYAGPEERILPIWLPF